MANMRKKYKYIKKLMRDLELVKERTKTVAMVLVIQVV
jgi:hypothetical protein